MQIMEQQICIPCANMGVIFNDLKHEQIEYR